MAKSTAARAEGRFKVLCCLGLGGEAVVPALLHELHTLIPSFSNSFLFADANGGVSHSYLENPDAVRVYPLYQREFRERREREFKGFAFSDLARTRRGVQEFRSGVSTDERTFRRSDLYNLVLRPAGYDSNFLRLCLRDGRRILGRLSMWRAEGSGNWSPEEKRRLASLEPFFVHALTMRSAAANELVDNREVGLIIADRAGKPIYFSAEGRRLLFLVTNPRARSGKTFSESSTLPAPVAQLCRGLSGVFSGDATAATPTYRHSNIWGGFAFGAHWLDEGSPASGLIGITIRHEVPLVVRLMQAVKGLPLGRRQTQVCMLMANGATNHEIAEQLGISKHTAIAHGRSIYERLNVHSRTELVNRLLSN